MSPVCENEKKIGVKIGEEKRNRGARMQCNHTAVTSPCVIMLTCSPVTFLFFEIRGDEYTWQLRAVALLQERKDGGREAEEQEG